MSTTNSYMVFSGTATRYLAEKICQSLGYPLGHCKSPSSLMASLPSVMRKASAAATFSLYRAPSPTATT